MPAADRPDTASAPAASAPQQRRGMMLVLSSPSGAGKTTISRELMAQDGNLAMSVSVTTRTPRPGEENGKHYHFVNEDRFQLMIDNGDMLEYALVYGKLYGTPKKPVMEALAAGRDVLFDIDWQGTRQLRQKSPDDVVTIFVLPPSWAELERRLRDRGQDAEEQIQKRMAKARDEISHYAEYHYVLVNHDLQDSIRKVQTILEAERLRRIRQTDLKDFVDGLRPD